MAALLHDVIEDTSVTKDEISETLRQAGRRAGRRRLQARQDRVPVAEDAQAENFRKMLLAMARDVRVILIKLADRLHNMRTLDAVPPAEAPARRARDDGDLRADRQPPRPERALPRAAGARLLAPLPARASGCSPRRSRRRAATGARWSARSWRRSRRGSPKPASRRRCTGARSTSTRSTARCSRSTSRSRRCSTSTASASSSRTCRPATSRSARCTPSTSRSRASSRTTSRSRRRTATSRCTPR